MKEIVINSCYGGYGLSEAAMLRYAELSGFKLFKKKSGSLNLFYKSADFEENDFFSDYSIERDDKILVQVVKELGERANGDFSQLKVVEIPDEVNWEIDEYDGRETIREVHRSWS